MGLLLQARCDGEIVSGFIYTASDNKRGPITVDVNNSLPSVFREFTPKTQGTAKDPVSTPVTEGLIEA